jgi:hypothetical protein
MPARCFLSIEEREAEEGRRALNASSGMDGIQPWRDFCSRRCMNFANAIKPKINTHSTTNMTMLLIDVGTLSGNLAVSILKIVLLPGNPALACAFRFLRQPRSGTMVHYV